MPPIKFKTFRNLLVVGGACLVGGAGFWLFSADSTTPPTTTPVPQAISVAPGAVPAQAPIGGDLRPVDRDILTFLAQPAAAEKVKDAFPRETYKVSFYRDGGPSWQRLKIDLDRNGRWDEKWTLEEGRPAKRQVSSADDEKYDLKYRWRGARWEQKS